MAGAVVTSGTTTVGVITIQVNAEALYVRVQNVGSAPIGVVARSGVAPADPVFGADDVFTIGPNDDQTIQVSGTLYDQGDPARTQPTPSVFVKAVCTAAGQTVTVTALDSP